ncbi:MAG: AAA family ATPase [Anaerolineales bacterium]|nr:AAA family ATPase [Anaerolineales bacterium]
MADNGDPLYPKLHLKEFRWTDTDDGKFMIPFSSGLTLLHGKNQAYRTTILRLIRYALGDDATRIDKDFISSLDSVELTFSANDEPIKVIRSCQHPTGRFDVYDTENGQQFFKRDMSLYLIEKLDLPKIFLKTRTEEGDVQDNPLSFYDISKAMLIDRDISYAGILSEVYETKRKETIRVMMGLTTPTIAEIENKERDLNGERIKLSQEISAIHSFLSEVNVPPLMDIEIRRQNLLTENSRIKSEEEAIRKQVKDSSQSDKPYEKLRSELVDKRQKIENAEQEILNLRNQRQKMTELREVLEAEGHRINRHFVSNHVVSTYTFTHCPRCLQEITSEMRKRETENNCMVCGRPIVLQEYDDAIWQKARRDSAQAIKETDELIANFDERIKSLQSLEDDLRERIEWIAKQLSSEESNYVSPIVEHITLNLAQQTSIEKELSQLDYQKRQREYAIYLKEEKLPQVKQELEKVTMELEVARQALGTTTERYNSFLTHFRKFMRGVKLEKPFEDADWDHREQLPTINGQSYKSVMSGPDLAIAVLGFYYSLLAMPVAHPRVYTNHPKLLIIDEPEQQKMGKDRYHQILQMLGRLAIEYREHIQIVIATASEDILPEFEDYAFEV